MSELTQRVLRGALMTACFARLVDNIFFNEIVTVETVRNIQKHESPVTVYKDMVVV